MDGLFAQFRWLSAGEDVKPDPANESLKMLKQAT